MSEFQKPTWCLNTRFEILDSEVFSTFIWIRIMQTFYQQIAYYTEPISLSLLSRDNNGLQNKNLTKSRLLKIIKETSDLLDTFSNYYTCISQPLKIYIPQIIGDKFGKKKLDSSIGYRLMWLTDLESDGSVEQEKLCLKRYSNKLEEDWEIGCFSIPGFRDKNYSLLTALDLIGIDNYICSLHIFD